MKVCVTGGAGSIGCIRDALGVIPRASVADGVDEPERGRFHDPDAACFANA